MKVGDRILFKSITRHNNRAAVRIITHLPKGREFAAGYIGVTFEGCRPFWVRPSEVIEVLPSERGDL